MRRLRQGLVVAIALLGCQGGLLSIELERSSEAVIARGNVLDALLGELGLDDLAAVDYTAAQELENQGVEPGDLRAVHLTRFRVAVVSPPEATLSFLDAVSVFVEAPDLDRIQVAAAVSIEDGATEVELEVEDVDLVDYVVSQRMTLSTSVTGTRPDVDTRIRADVVLDVEATVAGACKAARR